MASQEPIRLVSGTASPYTQKMVSLLRYRRLPYAISWGQPDQAKCLKWTNERYQALSEDDRASVDALLQGTGVETMLTAS